MPFVLPLKAQTPWAGCLIVVILQLDIDILNPQLASSVLSGVGGLSQFKRLAVFMPATGTGKGLTWDLYCEGQMTASKPVACAGRPEFWVHRYGVMTLDWRMPWRTEPPGRDAM